MFRRRRRRRRRRCCRELTLPGWEDVPEFVEVHARHMVVGD